VTPEERAKEREAFVRGLLADMRHSIVDLRDTEDTIRQVQAEYARDVTDDADRIIQRQRADRDARVTTAIGLGVWYRDRAQTFALAYMVERDVDDRKARR
jgi:hypothetical protein